MLNRVFEISESQISLESLRRHVITVLLGNRQCVARGVRSVVRQVRGRPKLHCVLYDFRFFCWFCVVAPRFGVISAA
jgi:hypothetical protein